ncbi:acetyl-CoA hydrolase/transferase family protein [Geomicrobium sediminis]|uniref:Succinyl-CoA:acetate CoA-transferase n=1 Tax=Geomicrobium sediminis TaxID=1347788 RepID=A0ABS2P9J2_9BACL|nr:acetyl-CoA hydrolase/transferase family protein [Geomicrobium sediminis]MBM7632077.1 succinyl-CoA:acetate CoA-transferase [Geomicrobium sediminis]
MNTQDKLRNPHLSEKIVTDQIAASWIKDGMTLGLSGFTRAGDAKAVPTALVERAKAEPMKVNVFTGASLGSDIDKKMAEVDLVNKRLPFQVDKTMRNKINTGQMWFIDQHLSHTAEALRQEVFGEIDFAIIEAIAITEDNRIIPTTSVGNSAAFVNHAKEVIVEINTAQPAALEGMHDIYELGEQGSRVPIPLTDSSDRIGETGIAVDPDKIRGIVFTNQEDSPSTVTPPDDDTEKIANHLIAFLEKENDEGRLPKTLAPLQSGIGTVANAVFSGLKNSRFTDLEVYSEVLQDSVFDLLDAGKVKMASGCSITLSEDKMNDVFPRLDDYKDRLVLRAQELSNHPEVIRRLGLISINTAVEADIYGNVNSTHVQGTKMMNGIGGSGDFARNARLGIFVTKSIAKNGDISSIVPFVSHVDHTEHDVDVLITEHGLADLRGLAPKERAKEIITNCADPLYKEQLLSYFDRAVEQVGGHTPHLLQEAFAWYKNFDEHGTMRERELVMN